MVCLQKACFVCNWTQCIPPPHRVQSPLFGEKLLPHKIRLLRLQFDRNFLRGSNWQETLSNVQKLKIPNYTQAQGLTLRGSIKICNLVTSQKKNDIQTAEVCQNLILHKQHSAYSAVVLQFGAKIVNTPVALILESNYRLFPSKVQGYSTLRPNQTKACRGDWFQPTGWR